MKVVILAGGLGTRLMEETQRTPKPLVTVGSKPILWHIMKIYSHHGLNEFVICCGHKGYLIKEYFSNYFLHMSDVTFDMSENSMQVHHKNSEPWKVTVVDTGDSTNTGGRIKRISPYIDDQTFCLAYGDCIGDVDIKGLIKFASKKNTAVCLTAVQPPGRYGLLDIDDSNLITDFHEKPLGDGGWINGGFFVIKPEALKYIDDDTSIWEQHALPKIIQKNELSAFKHAGFWRPMDTLRDKEVLEEYWKSETPPWKVWD